MRSNIAIPSACVPGASVFPSDSLRVFLGHKNWLYPTRLNRTDSDRAATEAARATSSTTSSTGHGRPGINSYKNLGLIAEGDHTYGNYWSSAPPPLGRSRHEAGECVH